MSQRYNTCNIRKGNAAEQPVQWLKGDSPTTGLPIGRTVASPRELSTTFSPQYEDYKQ
jgi:hypothetical protein